MPVESMPTYEYACTACANEWEEIQKISEDPLDTCPKCGQKTAKRQISGGNFILKGGGWYADLYSSSSNKKSGSSESKESKSESNGSASKSEGAGTGTGASASTSTTKSDSKAPAASPSKSTPPSKT